MILSDKNSHTIRRKLLFFCFFSCLLSCNTPKYSYLFETGKHLDFKTGRWLLNRSKSNSSVYDTELYNNSKDHLKEILGSSLFELQDVRQSKIIASELPFNMSKEELIQLQKDSGCDFLINIEGKVVSDSAGSISVPNQNMGFLAANEALVSIKIYDLQDGMIISSSTAYAKVSERGANFDNSSSFPILNTSSHTTMLKAAKRLIKKYEKNQL